LHTFELYVCSFACVGANNKKQRKKGAGCNKRNPKAGSRQLCVQRFDVKIRLRARRGQREVTAREIFSALLVEYLQDAKEAEEGNRSRLVNSRSVLEFGHRLRTEVAELFALSKILLSARKH